jgi:predicted NBD/HSP70 family sugar kinase
MLKVGSASRTRLAKIAGMSPATVSRIVEELIAQSVLTEVTNTESIYSKRRRKAGRPSTMLEFDRLRRRFLLVQLGVRQTRVAAAPVAIRDAEQSLLEFDTPDTKRAWFARASSVISQVPLGDIEAVVFSCPGVLDESQGRVLLCPNIHWAKDTDFAAGLRTIIDSPVVYLQEIRALALGQLAVDPSLQDFLLVDVGDGLGAASVVGARLQSGHLPLTGELGHTPVLGNQRPCGCGSTGCIETLVSLRGLLQSSVEHKGPRTWTALAAELESGGMPQWLKRSLDALAFTIAGVLNVQGIENVVLTGILTDFPQEVTDYLGERIRSAAMWSRLGDIKFKIAPRRRMAGMISAGIDRALFPIR